MWTNCFVLRGLPRIKYLLTRQPHQARLYQGRNSRELIRSIRVHIFQRLLTDPDPIAAAPGMTIVPRDKAGHAKRRRNRIDAGDCASHIDRLESQLKRVAFRNRDPVLSEKQQLRPVASPPFADVSRQDAWLLTRPNVLTEVLPLAIERRPPIRRRGGTAKAL